MINPVKPLLRVEKLSKFFNVGKGKILKAVDDVSFDIYEGETVSIVGESGCGKSTTGKCIVRLHEPTEGNVYFKSNDIFSYNGNKNEIKSLNRDFCKSVQMIFQNPYSSLNPRMTVKDIIGEGIKLHSSQSKSKGEIEARIISILESVGLNRDHISRFPHEFSGGQRQRIGIARVLSVEPKLIVCDEPISALDVSVQAQVINLLKKLQKEFNLTYLFIAHDLSVVKYISDRVVVMYSGNVVEKARTEDLFKNPLHPYTKALLSSIPVANPRIAKKSDRIVLQGEVVSPINPKKCCRFADRCSQTMEICKESIPLTVEVQDDHFVACHLYN